MPKNVTCEKTPAGLTLAWRWISGGDILGLVFSVFWYGVILAVYTITTLSYLGFLSMSGPRWLLYLILLPFLWLPRKLAYGSIAGILNRTVIQVTSSQLSIEHKPLPWPGNRSLPVSDLRQLYCRKVGDVRKDQSITYSLLATLKGGQEIELLKGIESPETVQYLEQEIEAWLGIEETAVANEMAG